VSSILASVLKGTMTVLELEQLVNPASAAKKKPMMIDAFMVLNFVVVNYFIDPTKISACKR
jgi:hypothetical protein